MLLIKRGTAGYEAENTARLFFPALKLWEAAAPPPAGESFIAALAGPHALLALVRLGGSVCWQAEPIPPQNSGADTEYALCRLLYGLLCRLTGCRPPWGMMTGVRPVRIIHDLRAAGADETAIRAHFIDHFDCTEEKYRLAMRIADVQRPVLEQAAPADCSVYIGIPFCPSRCSYCSFVSRAVTHPSVRALVQPYVDCLCGEIAAIRRTADACGLRVRALYVGGGTPTSLTSRQLEQLLQCLAASFDLAALREFTVEAGRPDCTDAEKLRLLRQYGVTRISVNPQTFSDEVLRGIGRRHTAQEILACYASARAAGHENINMDLIAGLPGDTVEGFAQSLQTAIGLAPESITVHTLTRKRAADITLENRATDADVGAMLARCTALDDAGYRPYYLYRQKGTLQNLENVGWSLPGREGLYNIYTMEEVHTILAAGAGGATKLVQPGRRHGRILRLYNCKFPHEYLARYAEVLQAKQKVEAFYAQYPPTQASCQP